MYLGLLKSFEASTDKFGVYVAVIDDDDRGEVRIEYRRGRVKGGGKLRDMVGRRVYMEPRGDKGEWRVEEDTSTDDDRQECARLLRLRADMTEGAEGSRKYATELDADAEALTDIVGRLRRGAATEDDRERLSKITKAHSIA